MIDEQTLAECELRTKAAGMDDEQYVFRLARRYLAFRKEFVSMECVEFEYLGEFISGDDLDAAADRLLKGGNDEAFAAYCANRAVLNGAPGELVVAAPSVPEEWCEVMAELAADLQAACDAEYPHRDQYPSVTRKYNNDMEIVEKARALLQSADHSERNLEKVAPNCRTCANRGLVNGLSQESYCDSCIYQGRDWRQNHFVDARKMADAIKRRCEACAILPCSCK